MECMKCGGILPPTNSDKIECEYCNTINDLDEIELNQAIKTKEKWDKHLREKRSKE